ncbi:LytTR family DNA-binding domain-containing protein [Anaerosporobacter faecicola]|uniref:LytTR family DNA-binding domain-containing protein n=1 Tax=Anaerosporobacter faecicola TaxID=2718714 RepID=UPI00143A21CB|nr:LytTR family DNA-binding domain-containing protein [Anaerosporobacter faecicola]
MKISIETIDVNKEEEILIRCHEVNDRILNCVKNIEKQNADLIGYNGDSIHRLQFADVYYFEAVDNKVFIYCKNKVYESKQKLYELEELCPPKKFFRASKSFILNISKIDFVKPSLSGRFDATLDNGETIVVSRQYVPILKSKLGL